MLYIIKLNKNELCHKFIYSFPFSVYRICSIEVLAAINKTFVNSIVRDLFK